MSSSSVHGVGEYHPSFHDIDGDIVLQASDAVDAKGVLDRKKLFKMRTTSLQRLSPVFADALHLSQNHTDSTSCDKIPHVLLAETAALLAQLLLFSKETIEEMPSLEALTLDKLLELYRACEKYGIPIAQAFIEAHLLQDLI